MTNTTYFSRREQRQAGENALNYQKSGNRPALKAKPFTPKICDGRSRKDGNPCA